METPQLKAYFDYPKFRQSPYRFLILKYNYFLQDQLIMALEELGHQVATLEIPQATTTSEAIKPILTKSVEVKPDAILTFNNLGCDTEGKIHELLSNLRIPTIVWYLDHCWFFGPRLKNQLDWLVGFTYEKRQVPLLEAMGFAHASYLPLATSRHYGKGASQVSVQVGNKMSFVGGTFHNFIGHFDDGSMDKRYTRDNHDLAKRKMQGETLDLAAHFTPLREPEETAEHWARYMGYSIMRETVAYRTGLISAAGDLPLYVFGEDDWEPYIERKQHQKPVDHNLKAPWIYRHSGVNLTMASLQHETALNQRYFDVPMAEGFLLSDWQEAVADHFEPGADIEVFHSTKELVSKVRYYLENPQKRESFVTKARQRILAEHLIDHRVEKMIGVMKRVCR